MSGEHSRASSRAWLLAPGSAGCTGTPVASVVMSETIELMETTETALAFDRVGETLGSLILQDTIRRDMGEYV